MSYGYDRGRSDRNVSAVRAIGLIVALLVGLGLAGFFSWQAMKTELPAMARRA